jgi:hypothetical protein
MIVMAPQRAVLGPDLAGARPAYTSPVSDARLKQDVRRIGTTLFGLPLYHFKYVGKPLAPYRLGRTDFIVSITAP